jgi:hypothetical protein
MAADSLNVANEWRMSGRDLESDSTKIRTHPQKMWEFADIGERYPYRMIELLLPSF